MTGSGKTVGIILIIVGLMGAVVVGAWLIAGLAGGELATAGAILGFALALVVIVPLVGVGAFLFLKGKKEVAAMSNVQKQRKILDMVLTQGRVRVAEIALELDASRDQVKTWVYDLVGKELFSGYINWEEGVLYSRDASLLKNNKCPNCGGQIELAGKGVVRCPYCGTEIFLS